MPPLGRSEYLPMTGACPEPRPYFGPRSLPLRGPCGFPFLASSAGRSTLWARSWRGAPAVELGGIDARRLTSAPPSASAAAARRRSVRAAVATSVGTFRRTAPAAGVVGPAVRYAVVLQEPRVGIGPVQQIHVGVSREAQHLSPVVIENPSAVGLLQSCLGDITNRVLIQLARFVRKVRA